MFREIDFKTYYISKTTYHHEEQELFIGFKSYYTEQFDEMNFQLILFIVSE